MPAPHRRPRRLRCSLAPGLAANDAACSVPRCRGTRTNEATDFYDLESPGLGGVFLDDLEHTLAQVVEFPSAAPALNGVRKRLLTKFPYALLYSLRDDEIRILAVAHQRRRPFYWQGREEAQR